MTRMFMAGVTLVLGGLLLSTNAPADVISVGMSAFPGSSALIDFTGLPNGLEVNGLTISGVRFDYTLGGAPLNGAVINGNGSGTGNISPPNIVSLVPNNTGILGITLPSPVYSFGYGFAVVLRGGGVLTFDNITSVSAFSGNTLLGSVSFSGHPADPGNPSSLVSGGFAGILSTTSFNRVELTFLHDQTAVSSFAVDNLQFASIPEPSTFVLVSYAKTRSASEMSELP